MAIPSWAVSQCDGGHGSAAGCERLLLPYAAERLYLFGARPQGMPESFSLSWPECGRTIPVQAVQFWSLGDNSSTASKSWRVGKTLSTKRQRTSSAIIGPPVRLGLAPYRNFFRTGAQVRNRPFQSRFAVAHPTWSRTWRQRQHVGQVALRADANQRPAFWRLLVCCRSDSE
jgi:hypothetical protein